MSMCGLEQSSGPKAGPRCHWLFLLVSLLFFPSLLFAAWGNSDSLLLFHSHLYFSSHFDAPVPLLLGDSPAGSCLAAEKEQAETGRG